MSRTPPVTVPFWVDDVAPPAGITGPLPADADVVVVGSGYTGLSAARRLAELGRDVCVLEQGAIASGASSMNGGMVEPGFKRPMEAVFSRFGPELGRELWKASRRALELVAEIIESEGIEAHFHRRGAAVLATHPRDVTGFERHVRWAAAELGAALEVVTEPGQLRRQVIDSPQVLAALVDPEAAGLHPAAYAFGLARAVARKGVRLVDHTRAERIRRHSGGYRVFTTEGVVSCGEVLVATNGYTRGLLPGLDRRVVSIGSYIAVTEPLSAEVAERLIPGNRMLYTSRRLLNYFRRTPDDRILMGGRHNLAPDLDLDESARFLAGRIRHFFPELEGVPVTHSWGGRLGVTFDLMPHIGRLHGVWYALGYGGHGVALATYLGAEVGSLIGGETARSPFLEIPHPTRPYHWGRPWYLPAASRMFRALDRLGL
jgi:glycine/D-amino acid oxidase-like deaminating enzyme